MGPKGVAGPERRWRRGRESFSPESRGNLFWEASQAAKLLLNPEGLKRRRLERAAGKLNNRRRPMRGGECTHAKWPHSRTSGPPSRPSVYLFTFPGSSNTSAFSELRSEGAALVLPASQFFSFPTPRLYAPCWGRGEVRKAANEERKEDNLGK